MTSFFGRRVVLSAFILAILGWGTGFYGPPVFLHAVTERTGWPLVWVSAAVTLHFLVGAVIVANLPRLYRRFNLPVITTGGAVLLATGLLGWALAASPWHLVLAALATGAGWVTMGAAAINAIIAPWYNRRRPRALSTAYNGASIGGVILSPLWVLLIDRYGFPAAASTIGVTAIVIVSLMSLLVFRIRPEMVGQFPDGDAEAAAPASTGTEISAPLRLSRDPRFLTLAAGMALGLFAQIGMVAHLFSVLAPAIGVQAAGFAMGLATACAIAGRSIAVRVLATGLSRRTVAAGSYGVQIAGSLLFFLSGDSTVLAICGVVLFGAGIGNATSLPPLIAQSEFPAAEVQRVVSLIVATGQACYAFAPAIYGLIRTIGTNGDGLFFLAVGAVQFIAVCCFLSRGQRAAAPQPG
ncbi:MAG: MFS transporter [Rhodospirillales bacterium]